MTRTTTKYSMIALTFVADVVDDVADAPLTAVGFAVGTSLGAVTGTSSHCCSIAAAHGIIIIARISAGVIVSARSGAPELPLSVWHSLSTS